MDFIGKKLKTAWNDGHITAKKLWVLALSLPVPAAVFWLRPLGMAARQSAVIAILLLVVTWWCTNAVNKIVSSAILLMSFVLLADAPLTTVFSFPLSDSFLLIALTYLFSRGIANSRVAEKFLEPVLTRFAKTPFRAIVSVVAMLAITMYIIPQPLARLIIVADIFAGYLAKTNASEKTKSVLMFSVFVCYVFINMCSMKADIIINTLAVNVAGLPFSDLDWIVYMALPSLVYLALAVGLLFLLFRRDLAGVRLHVESTGKEEKTAAKATRKDAAMLVLLAVTATLWVSEPLHGVPAWLITLFSLVVMALLGVFCLKDFNSLDIAMLVFLTAAMSIGGVMRANGTADLIFHFFGSYISAGSAAMVVAVTMGIAMCMHMLLGSNSTTISVVIPGLIIMLGNVLPPAVIMCLVYITLATHWLFPFHSVGMMMGVSRKCFPAGYMIKMGLPMTVLVFAAVFGLYLPWWRILGLL